MRGQVVAELGHEAHGPRVDAPRGPRAGAQRLDVVATVDARERLRHLAAVRVLHAHEEHAFPCTCDHLSSNPTAARNRTRPGRLSARRWRCPGCRSEAHTSELQSPEN